MTHVCPLCGAEAHLPPVIVCLERRGAKIGERFLHIPAQRLKILDILANAKGRIVEMDSLIMRVWDIDDEPDGAPDTIKVHIWHLKRDLKGSGMTIKNEHKIGYRLAPEDK